jgi:hypothetical protein
LNFFCFSSIDRLNKSKANFTRSSSFHDSLRRSNKTTTRTCSTSPSKPNNLNLKRSKSNKEITSKSLPIQRSKSSNKTSSTGSFIPLINQCINPEKTPTRTKTPISPPKRPAPPVPKKPSSSHIVATVDNHIYDSFHESPIFTYPKLKHDENRTMPKPPMRVTEL